jgi:hypothetical protein
MILDLKLRVRSITSSFFPCLLEFRGPRLGNLVGLLGGLEGRVAGVVLELVGCGGTSLVSIPCGSAHVERSSKPLPSLRVQIRAHVRRLRVILLFLIQSFRESEQQGRRCTYCWQEWWRES